MQRFGRFNRPGLKGSANYSLLGGASGCSDPAPVDPTSVAATPDSPAIGVAVSWTASSTAQYNVYRNTTNSTTGATLVGSSSGSGGMSYVDNSANSGSNRPLASTTYFYWVQGVTCGGTSALIPASQNSTGGVATAAITYTTYTPDNANLTVSDFITISEQNATRLRFSRPAGISNTFSGCAPNSRVSFTTNATYLRLNLAYANAPTAGNRISQGAILVNGTEYATFNYTGALPGNGQHDFTLPGGNNVVTVLWPISANTDLTSVLLDSGASLAAGSARPTNRIVFHGDSITQGFSVTKPTLAWTERIAINRSRQSFNTAYGAAPTRWADAPQMLASLTNGDFAVYMTGTNDLINQYALTTYGSQMQGFIIKARTLLTSSAPMFVCSPIFCSNTYTITIAQYRAEAKSTVEGLMTYGNGDANLFYLSGADLMPSNGSGLADPFHPNDLGAGEIYANMEAAMSATPPAAPSNLSATVISSSQVDLSWTDNASTETGFIVQRRFPATTGSWQQVGVTLAGTTTFSDTGLASSSQYEYRVCAYNGGGSSAFTSGATATTTSGTANRIRVLVVAGGGGGGGAGGGGAGGVREDLAFVASPGTTYTVTIGGGGAGGGGGSKGSSGSLSSFGVVGNILESAGGGGGGGFSLTNQDAVAGGSGGGAGGTGSVSGAAGAGNTPVTSPAQGNNGGTSGSGVTGFGGGGGAGQVGGIGGHLSLGGRGGDGLLCNISGLYQTYGGGGGGGGGSGLGLGGRGGGGDGRASSPSRASTAGTVNTGGGGGGGYNDTGKAGGSGIVVLRMPTSEYTGVTTGSPAVTTAGNDTVLTFTASGSYKA